jgi:hypothetical protein
VARCEYMVAYVPPGCTDYYVGQIVYSDCPDDGTCRDATLEEEGACQGVSFVAMSCQCEQ